MRANEQSGFGYDSRKGNGHAGFDLTQELIARATPGTDQEFADSIHPDPHIFMRRDEGLFPVGEATVVAGLQRAGKTLATVGLAAAQVVGVSVGGMAPTTTGLGTLFVSAEDSRAQLLRKIAAAADATEQRNGKAAAAAVRAHLPVLDLGDDALSRYRAFVEVATNRQPQIGRIVSALVAAIERVQRLHEVQFGMVVCETASRLNDGDESNLTLRLLADAVQRLARQCGVAALLTHHLSQIALANVRDLNFSTGDIRGATSLVANARQNAILVHLGSDRYPHADSDKRTLLRAIVDAEAPTAERGNAVAVLVTLDSSKSALPPPSYFRQYSTPYGPALLPIPTPEVLAPLSWQEQVARLRAESAERRGNAREQQACEDVQDVVAMVVAMHREGKDATAKAVSTALGHGADWATPRLDRAVREGRLRSEKRRMKYVREAVTVYLPLNQSENQSARAEAGEDRA